MPGVKERHVSKYFGFVGVFLCFFSSNAFFLFEPLYFICLCILSLQVILILGPVSCIGVFKVFLS